MAQTTTSYNACDVHILLDNAAGTPVDISGSSNAISATWTNSTATISTFGASGWTKSNSGCMKNGTITLTVLGSTAAAEAFSSLTDWFFNYGTTARTLTWFEPDKNVGSHKFSGEVRLTSLTGDRPSDASDPVTTVAELITDGAWTWVTNAT